MTKLRRTIQVTCTLAILFAISPAIRADIISTFDSSADGWISTAGVCPFLAVAGNPAGDLYCGVQVLGPTIFAPQKFSGNDSAAYGNQFSLDIFNQYGNIAVDLELIGAGLDLDMPFAISAVGVPPSTAWKPVSILLTEAGGFYLAGTQTVPTAAQFKAMLGDVVGLRINTVIPTYTDVGFDNIRLGGVSPVPEPATWALLALGGCLCIALRRRLRSQ